jgi:hypothetical protein
MDVSGLVAQASAPAAVAVQGVLSLAAFSYLSLARPKWKSPLFWLAHLFLVLEVYLAVQEAIYGGGRGIWSLAHLVKAPLTAAICGNGAIGACGLLGSLTFAMEGDVMRNHRPATPRAGARED